MEKEINIRKEINIITVNPGDIYIRKFHTLDFDWIVKYKTINIGCGIYNMGLKEAYYDDVTFTNSPFKCFKATEEEKNWLNKCISLNIKSGSKVGHLYLNTTLNYYIY